MTVPIRIAASALALGAAFLAGRFSRSERVVTKDVVHVEQKIEYRDRVVTQTAKVASVDQAAQIRTVTVVKTRWLPGGAVEKEQTTTLAKDTDRHEAKQESTQATRDVLATKDLRLDETHATERTERPGWSLALLPGYQFAGSKAINLYGPLVLGAAVERRIIGPVFVGAWASTSGAAGIVLRGEF